MILLISLFGQIGGAGDNDKVDEGLDDAFCSHEDR
jgi:hypothetical protein